MCIRDSATSDAAAPERKRKSRWDNTICTAEIGPAPTDSEFDGYCEETGVTEAADKHACAEDSLGAWRSASMADCVIREKGRVTPPLDVNRFYPKTPLS